MRCPRAEDTRASSASVFNWTDAPPSRADPPYAQVAFSDGVIASPVAGVACRAAEAVPIFSRGNAPDAWLDTALPVGERIGATRDSAHGTLVSLDGNLVRAYAEFIRVAAEFVPTFSGPEAAYAAAATSATFLPGAAGVGATPE